MFLMRLDNLVPLADAVFILSQISDEADVIFSPSSLSLIVSDHTLRFLVKFELSIFPQHHFDQDVRSRISLQALHNAMRSGENFRSMAINVLDTMSSMILTFQTSVVVGDFPPLRRELILSPSQEAELGQIGNQKFIIIQSHDFRRVVIEASPFQDESVRVSVTSSQVKFSIASAEIILSRADGKCQIVGYGDDEVQFEITLQPTLFFLELTNETDIVWFYKTPDDSHYVMCIPAVQIYVEYLIYFSQIVEP